MEKGKISSLQMGLLLYPVIIATAILSVPSITAKYAGNDMWISPIIGSFAGVLTIIISVWLHHLYPGKTVIEFSGEIIGRIPGKLVNFLILFFYLITTGVVVRSYSEFIVTSFLFKTPQIVVISSMVALCAFCVYGGLEVLARIGQLLFPVFLLPILFSVIFLAPDLQMKNIFPILENGLVPPLKGAIPLAGWFAEFFLIAFLLPFLSDKKKGMKFGLFSVMMAMLSLVVVNLVVLFVLGETTKNKLYPLMNAARYASVGGFFENMEAVVMTVWIAGAFVKITAFYYVSALGIAQYLNLSDYRPIIWPLGILIVQLSFWGLPNMMYINKFSVRSFPIYSVFIQIIIPLLLLVMAFVWKRKKKKG